MTTIFDNGNFWIESVQVVARNVAAGAVDIDDRNFEKGGHIVGVSAVIDLASGSAPNINDAQITVTKLDSSSIVYGDEMTGIRIRSANNTGAQLFFGAHIIIFLFFFFLVKH